MNLFRIPLASFVPQRRRPRNTLLGLAFEPGGVRGAEVRRVNGSVEVTRNFHAPLSLDLLTGEPELVGHEIRKQLDAAGVRERWCTVCLPQNWVLTLVTDLPDISGEDRESFLATEAERGFPSGGDSLMVAHSVFCMPGGQRRVTLAGISRAHVERLQAVLTAAQLRPVSFALGTPALQPAGAADADGVMALQTSGNAVHLQVTCGGGIAALRSLQGAFEFEGGTPQLQADIVARELRITLGQLPAEITAALRHLRVYGDDERSTELVEVLRPRFEPQGIQVELVRHHEPGQLPLGVPPGMPVSPAFSLVVRHLAGQRAPLEFLPPRVSPWKQVAERYTSRKLAWAGGLVGGIAAIGALAFGAQQVQLMYWRGKWNAMKAQVTELDSMQRNLRQYRPWYDESFRSLNVLRRLTEAFPEDGSVSAKSIDIRDRTGVTCSGVARASAKDALDATIERLRSAPEVAALKVPQINGPDPLRFTVNFQWKDIETP